MEVEGGGLLNPSRASRKESFSLLHQLQGPSLAGI